MSGDDVPEGKVFRVTIELRGARTKESVKNFMTALTQAGSLQELPGSGPKPNVIVKREIAQNIPPPPPE